MADFEIIEPRKTRGVEVYESEGYDSWRAIVNDFVKQNIIGPIIDDEDIINILINSPVWEKMFVHKTWNPNTGHNYERLEKIGDKVMGLVFDEYLLEYYPDITEAGMGESKKSYLSKKEQGKISKAFNLAENLLIRKEVGVSVYEDLLEALFGAIFLSGQEQEDFDGLGYTLSRLFFDFLYRPISKGGRFGEGATFTGASLNLPKVDFSKPPTDAKTQVKELLQSVGWLRTGVDLAEYEESKVTYDNGVKTYIINLKFSPSALRLIQAIIPPEQYRKILSNPYFASNSGTIKKKVEKDVYKQALANLKLIIRRQVIEDRRKAVEEIGPLGNLMVRARNKALEEGYDDIEIMSSTGSRLNTSQLVGIKTHDDGTQTKEILYTLTGKSGIK